MTRAASRRRDEVRWQTVATRLVVVLAALALLGGCTAGATPSAPPTQGLVSPSSSPTSSPSTSPSSSSMPSAPPASPTASPAPRPTDSLVGQVVNTLADDGLRVRSQPRISDDSEMYDPLLPLGTQLLVLDGPVSASGYTWHQVVPLTSAAPSLEYRGSAALPSGWVASASRDGVPWIAASVADCPPLPIDFRSLAALPPAVGLVCFPQLPITVEARLISCNCDIDGGWYTPFWFSRWGASGLLVEPDVTSAPPDMADWFALNLDPAGEHPDVLPIGEVVEVTGIFDHPAAASCTWTEMDGDPVPTQGCRLEFAVTRMLVQGP